MTGVQTCALPILPGVKSGADSARKSPRQEDRTTRSSKARSAAARDLREEERTPPRPRGGPLESLAMALGAGLILAAAFPPLGLWWTAPITLAALNLLVAGRGMWAGAGLGLVFGLGLFAPLLHFAAVTMGNILYIYLCNIYNTQINLIKNKNYMQIK